MEWTYQATVRRIVDGDTLRCDIDLGFSLELHDRAVRVAHMNAPEMATPEGKSAREYAVALLPVGTVVTVVSHKLDKYGRVLGSVLKGDVDFATAMIAAGHAVAYEGGH